MAPEEQHLTYLGHLRARCILEGDGPTVDALTAAIAALQREGQMEARLRSFMAQAFDMGKMRTDPSTAQYFIGVDDFTGFCAVIDSEILEASND